MTNSHYAVFRPVSVRSQVVRALARLVASPVSVLLTVFRLKQVAGTNFLFLVDVGGGQRVELRAFLPLPYTRQPIQLVSVTPVEAAAPAPRGWGG